MPVSFTLKNPSLRTYILLHQTHNSLSKCEEEHFAKVGLTAQQHAVLMAIKYSQDPVTPTFIAEWVDRHLNSVTLILNRMQKNGLVKRVRNPRDHRSLCLVMTERGEKLLNESTPVGWKLIQDVLSNLSEEEVQTLANLLEKVRNRAIEKCYENKKIKEIDVSKRCELDRLKRDSINRKK